MKTQKAKIRKKYHKQPEPIEISPYLKAVRLDPCGFQATLASRSWDEKVDVIVFIAFGSIHSHNYNLFLPNCVTPKINKFRFDKNI